MTDSEHTAQTDSARKPSVEDIFILQTCCVADPEAVREGEWREDGPVMGWTPRLGKYRVSHPETGRVLFATPELAMDAANAFKRRCAEKLVEMDEELPPGWVWSHRDIGLPEGHLASSKCWCNPVPLGPDDSFPEQDN